MELERKTIRRAVLAGLVGLHESQLSCIKGAPLLIGKEVIGPQRPSRGHGKKYKDWDRR
jgi:hypothetical protein